MQNYSQTQLANFAAIAGFIVIVANQFDIIIDQNLVIFALASIFSVLSLCYSIWNRYKKGDITLGAKRK